MPMLKPLRSVPRDRFAATDVRLLSPSDPSVVSLETENFDTSITAFYKKGIVAMQVLVMRTRRLWNLVGNQRLVIQE